MSDNLYIARYPLFKTVAFLALVLFTGLRAEAIRLLEPTSPAKATRILRFPSNQSVGWLSVEPESGPTWDTRLVSSWTGNEFWLPLGAARGEVSVPEGRHTGLNMQLAPRQEDISKLAPRHVQGLVADRVYPNPPDLSELAELDVNDLYWLTINFLSRRTDADRILEPIGRLMGLKMLSLNSTGLTDRGMQQLRALRLLRSLELRGEYRVGNAGLAVLKDLPDLEYLDLDTQVTDIGLKDVGSLKNLRWLRIHTGRFWGPGLAELANLPRLERLCIGGSSPLSNRHVRYLEGLTHLKSLTFWGVAGALTDDSLASIGKLKDLEALYFILTNPRFSAAGVAHLKGMKQLKIIDFSQSQLGGQSQQEDKAVRQLVAALPQLESLKIGGQVTAEGMKDLGTLRNLKCLHIGLKDYKSGYSGPTGLSHLAGLTRLEELCIGGRGLSDQDLIDLEPLSNLKELIIHGPKLTDRGLATIGKLRQLESLKLNAGVTRSGLNQLDALTNLRNLDVGVSSEAIVSATSDELPMDLSGMKNLRRLSLKGFSLLDADLACLANLRALQYLSIPVLPAVSLRHLQGLPELTSLNIGGLSDTRTEDLSVLASLPKLETLRLAGSIPDAALPALGQLRSGWSLTIQTDKIIRAETLADLKQSLAATDYEYVHIQDLPTKPQPETIKPLQRQSAPKTPRVNRRPPQK